MKEHIKIYLIAAVVIILFARLGLAFPNEPDNFNGIKWESSISNIEGMKMIVDIGEDIAYARPNDSFDVVRGITLDVFMDVSILYGAYKDRFYQGTVMYKGEESFEMSKRKLIAKHGMWSDYEMERDRGILKLFWKGEKVDITLTFNIPHKVGYVMYTYLPIYLELH